MKHETKFRLQVAAVCAAVGFVAAPQVLKGLLWTTRNAQRVLDVLVREVL